MLNHLLFSPFSEQGSSGGGNTIGDELIIILDNKEKDTSDEYQEKILVSELEIKNIQNIIMQYTGSWIIYQENYTNKKTIIDQLEAQYEQLQWKNMTAEEQEEYKKNKEEFEKIMKEIFGSMGFDQEGVRGTFESEEDYFHHQEEQNKKKKDANHTTRNVSDISGPLVEQLKDMSMKDLWRKIIHLLHPSRLSTNIEIVGDTAYLLYCEDLYRILIDLHSKDDIGSMIVTLQDAGIQLKDGKFILPSKKERGQIQQRSQLHKKREELQERLSAMKQSYIYIFYLKFTKGDVAKELRELDDKIEELQDLIASYQTIHNE